MEEMGERGMIASKDIEMGEDITSQLSPIACSLHDPFLHSHCSSCFSPLSSSTKFPPFLPTTTTSTTSHHLSYCSSLCSSSDSDLHFSSSEFHLLQSTYLPHSTTDLRVALRLLRYFASSVTSTHRISGLLTNRDKLLSSVESDTLLRIRDGARAMAAAIGNRDDTVLEEAALCTVITNAVEVLDGGGRNIGVAVYDTAFSWINHSCSPNACYRFLRCSLPSIASSSSKESKLLVVPAGNQGDTGNSNHSQAQQGRNCGPKVTVRSIKRIKKGEEVTVAYTDLLQPKAVRQAELLSKYQFVCCCKRCAASPPAYIDRVLQEVSATTLDSEKATNTITDFINEAIDAYISFGDPKSCCETLNNILTQGVRGDQLEDKEENSQSNFTIRLHPLHHLSLSMYTILASAYKVRASELWALDSDIPEHMLESFEMMLTSTGYSLLLANATHHLFNFEASLIVSLANFWSDAGESLVTLSKSSIWDLHNISDTSFIAEHVCAKCKKIFCANSFPVQLYEDLESITNDFIGCITYLTRKVWTFLSQRCQYLNVFKDPTDFSWLEYSYRAETGHFKFKAQGGEEVRMSIFSLGAHCLVYGKILAAICYGQPSVTV